MVVNSIMELLIWRRANKRSGYFSYIAIPKCHTKVIHNLDHGAQKQVTVLQFQVQCYRYYYYSLEIFEINKLKKHSSLRGLVMKPGIKGKTKILRFMLEGFTNVHNLLLCTHTLSMNYVTIRFYWLVPQHHCVLCTAARPRKRTKTYKKELCRVSEPFPSLNYYENKYPVKDDEHYKYHDFL